MIRFVGYHPPIIGHASIPWESFNDYQLQPRFLTRVLFDSSDPQTGPGGLYVGPLGVFGVLLCVIAYRRAGALERFLIITFGLMALYFLMAAFGTHFGLAYLHFRVPLVNLIREATRHLVIFTTFVAVLAAFGFQSLGEIVTGKSNLAGLWYRALNTIIAFGLLIFLAALAIDHRRMSGWLVLTTVPLGLVLLPAASRQARAIGSGLLLLVTLASMVAPPGTQPFFVSEYLRPDNLIVHRVLQRVSEIPDIAKYRVAVLDNDRETRALWNNASFYGIRTFYFAFTVLPLAQLHEMFDEQAVNLRKLHGAKYIICGHGAKPLDPDARLLFDESGYGVYQVTDALGPYTLVHTVRSFPGVVPFRAQVAQGFDYHHIAALKTSRKQNGSPLLTSMESTGSVLPVSEDFIEPVARTANHFAVLVHSSRPGVLIFNERWSKDWHARVNSQPAEVLRANFSEPAVVLGAGRNYVEFEYKPMLFWWLLILQRSTFLLLVICAIGTLSRRHRSAVPAVQRAT